MIIELKSPILTVPTPRPSTKLTNFRSAITSNSRMDSGLGSTCTGVAHGTPRQKRSRQKSWLGEEARGPSPPVRGKPEPTASARVRLRSIPARAGEAAGGPSSRRASSVHPRPCGGSQVAQMVVTFSSGPSPPVRGKRAKSGTASPFTRSIPARAGEAICCHPDRVRPRVHPRPCGGSALRRIVDTTDDGPSPPVRGKLRGRHAPPGSLGSIPARAGEATKMLLEAANAKVHPRPCGGSCAAVL